MRDLIEEELSSRDFISDPPRYTCRFHVGDRVLLQRPSRRQKCLPPFEPGWQVVDIVAPSTVRIDRPPDFRHQKTVNVDLLKLDKAPAYIVPHAAGGHLPPLLADEDADGIELEFDWAPALAPAERAYNLHD